MLGRLVALRLAIRVCSVLALLCTLVAASGCIGGSTPYPPAVTAGTDAGGVRDADGSAVDAGPASDLGARDLGVDIDPHSDASVPADGAALDAAPPDADAPDADAPDAALLDAALPDADAPDADLTDADLTDADLTDADLIDADEPDAAP